MKITLASQIRTQVHSEPHSRVIATKAAFDSFGRPFCIARDGFESRAGAVLSSFTSLEQHGTPLSFGDSKCPLS